MPRFGILILLTSFLFVQPASAQQPKGDPKREVVQEFDAGRASLEEVLQRNYNAYVYIIQRHLGLRATGLLTPSTIAAINSYCDANGIGGTCRRGPLTVSAARALKDLFGSVAEDKQDSGRSDQVGRDLHNTPNAARPAAVQLVDAELNCGAIGEAPPFTRQYQVSFDGEKLSMSSGERSGSSFETWYGTLKEGSIEVTGEYIEGTREIKPLDFTLVAVGRNFEGEGKRGPRTCFVSVKM